MKRILLMAAAVAGLNSFASAPSLTKRANTDFTVNLNVQDLALGAISGSVSYDKLMNNKVSVVASGYYVVENSTGRDAANAYASNFSQKTPSNLLEQKSGFGLAVAGHYHFNSNQTNGAFAGVKLGLANGKFDSWEVKNKDARLLKNDFEKKDVYSAQRLNPKKEKAEKNGVKYDDQESITVLKATVPVGYQWVASNNLVLTTSVALGVSYNTDADKDKTWEGKDRDSVGFVVEPSFLEVGYKF